MPRGRELAACTQSGTQDNRLDDMMEKRAATPQLHRQHHHRRDTGTFHRHPHRFLHRGPASRRQQKAPGGAHKRVSRLVPLWLCRVMSDGRVAEAWPNCPGGSGYLCVSLLIPRHRTLACLLPSFAELLADGMHDYPSSLLRIFWFHGVWHGVGVGLGV